MLDHITLRVRSVSSSIAFYQAALEPLGYIVKAHHEPTLGFGVDDGTPHADFYIAPADSRFGHSSSLPCSPITHLAFRARSREEVRAFHAAALHAGGQDNGAPGLRDYHPGYYAAYVLDPDGNNVEVVTDWADDPMGS